MERPRRNAALPILPMPDSKSEDSSNCDADTQIILTPPSGYEDVIKGEVERYKLVVVGDEECGKTALLNTLVKSSDFEVDDSFATFDECVTDIKTPQEHVEFSLYEITGMDDYRSFRLELYRGADVFLVCFDIGRPCTLHSVEHKWSSEIAQEFPDVPFLLIGCKNDLRTDSAMFSTATEEMMEEADSVSRAKAEKVSRNIGAKAYVECCAKTRWNIDHVFKAAAEAILTKDDQKTELLHSKHNHSVLRRFSRLTTDRHHSSSKRGSIFSFVVGSNA